VGPACRTASQTMRGQEEKDQMQLCMAQARLDCLKQAIDQRIVGPQRKEFIACNKLRQHAPSVHLSPKSGDIADIAALRICAKGGRSSCFPEALLVTIGSK
jgi:hypothetical protein